MSTTFVQPHGNSSLAPQKSERIISLDVFRGITIAGMILVNDPGSWSHVYSPLTHANWDGWTPTDLIFPFFLFIVGVAIPFSLTGQRARGDSQRKIFSRTLRRTIILFVLGLFVTNFPYYDLSTFRIPGVLQRIALCYFFAVLLFIKTEIRGQAVATVVLLVAYWLLMKLIPVPGYGAGVLEREGNLAAYLDNLLMHGHLYRQHWDPEGLLSTIPAIATTMLGVLAGHWLRSSQSMGKKTLGLLLAGIGGVVIGQIMDSWFPINKNLWKSSYVVFTGGMALLFLGVCYWLVDGKGYRWLATPFVIFGVNPITVYVLSGLVAQLMDLCPVTGSDGTPEALKTEIYENFFASWAGPLNGSLFFALAYVLVWLAPMVVLYRRRIFLRI